MATQEMLKQIIAGKAKQLADQTDDYYGAPASPGASRRLNERTERYSSYDDAMFDAQFSAEYDPNFQQDNDIPYVSSITESDIKRSAMPISILESMKNNPIDKGALMAQAGGASIVDSLGIDVPAPKKRQPRQQMTEQAYRGGAAPAAQGGGGVDYSIIKAIVNECLSNYFSNNSLNENALKTVGLKNGKITLVDNSGNVYQAKLEKIGNKNKIGD